MLTTRCSSYSLVIEKNDILNSKDISKETIRDYLDSQDNIIFYAMVLHDKDKDTLPHYHIVIELHTQLAKKTIINDIARTLMVNKTLVQVQATYDLAKSVQYLTHKNENPNEKHIYDFSEVITSDIISCDSLNRGANPFKLDIAYLRQVCASNVSLTDVYEIIGLENSRRYAMIIKHIWEESAAERCENVNTTSTNTSKRSS